MIIKIQMSLMTKNLDRKIVLIHNKDRSLQREGTATEDVKKLMNGRLTAYFNAHVYDELIKVYEEAPEQDW